MAGCLGTFSHTCILAQAVNPCFFTIRASGILNPKFLVLRESISLPPSMRARVAGSKSAYTRNCHKFRMRLTTAKIGVIIWHHPTCAEELHKTVLVGSPAEQSFGAEGPSVHFAPRHCPPKCQVPCQSPEAPHLSTLYTLYVHSVHDHRQ